MECMIYAGCVLVGMGIEAALSYWSGYIQGAKDTHETGLDAMMQAYSELDKKILAKRKKD